MREPQFLRTHSAMANVNQLLPFLNVVKPTGACWAAAMREYRLYCLAGDGRFTKMHEIASTGDAEALMIAQRMKLPVKCELWERARKVAILDPEPMSP